MNHFNNVAICLAFAATATASGGLPRVGAQAPTIRISQVVTPKNSRVSLAELRGKTIVVDFWATWCGPCTASMPHLNTLVAQLDPKRFAFLAIDDESVKTVKAFLARQSISAIVAMDRAGASYRAFGVISRPTTIVIDPKGKVALVTQTMNLTVKDLIAIDSAK